MGAVNRTHDWALMDCECQKPECSKFACTACLIKRTNLNRNDICPQATALYGTRLI